MWYSNVFSICYDSVSLPHCATNLRAVYCIYTQRWATGLFKTTRVKNLTVKSHCETRCDSKVSGVKAIHYQVGDIYDALTEVAETSKDPKCQTETQSSAKTVRSYKFAVMWYNLLKQINVIRKKYASTVTFFDQTSRFRGYIRRIWQSPCCI